jgi:hypothetical protein
MPCGDYDVLARTAVLFNRVHNYRRRHGIILAVRPAATLSFHLGHTQRCPRPRRHSHCDHRGRHRCRRSLHGARSRPALASPAPLATPAAHARGHVSTFRVLGEREGGGRRFGFECVDGEGSAGRQRTGAASARPSSRVTRTRSTWCRATKVWRCRCGAARVRTCRTTYRHHPPPFSL